MLLDEEEKKEIEQMKTPQAPNKMIVIPKASSLEYFKLGFWATFGGTVFWSLLLLIFNAIGLHILISLFS